MKKIGLICATALMGMSLVACNNSAAQKSSKSNSSSTVKSTKAVRHHKHTEKKNQQSSTSSTESSSSQNSQVSQSSMQQSGQNTKQGSAQQQTTQSSNNSNSDPHLADGTDVYDLPYSDPRNPDSYKQGELMDIAGDPKYQNPDGSMNEQGAALASSIEDTFHQPQN
ncbi:hypothetical protein LMC00_00500 [Limosilactobacillus reuteri]|uniref:hypothetical protein n=1 Tax=Limosilactobacillus reuteri TaxID=1598 RepID=UPI001E3379A9|nr:hypothetical protein [Limosilactobacillus reuteri]MCC4394452.1 hypothetical protein [Limosilactobacillus reuteri]MCC4400516.1 hypothetical protein [Limosilactobacillus reuteri]